MKMKRCTVSLLLSLAAMSLVITGDYSLDILVSSYTNQFNSTFNLQCCKATGCADGCDSIFWFCLRPAGFDVTSNQCPLGSYNNVGFPVNSTTAMFDFNQFTQDVGNISNPMLFIGHTRWTGSFQLLVRIDHVDLNGQSTLIDLLLVEGRSLAPENDFSDLVIGFGAYGMATMAFRLRARCLTNYYGSTCESFCSPTNGTNGHYTCDSQGNKICLYDYVDPASNCTYPLQFCPAETVEGVTYERTMNGITVMKLCPVQMGNEQVTVSGNITRTCSLNGTWSEVSMTPCARAEFQRISQQASSLFEQPNEVIDEQEVEDIIESLSQATDPNTFTNGSSLLVEDLRITTDVLNKTIGFLLFDLEDDGVVLNFNEEVLNVINNVLDERNLESWNTLQTMGAGSEKVLQSAELYGQYVAEAMKSGRVDTGNAPEREFKRRNIILRAAMVDGTQDDTYPVNVDEGKSFAQSLISSSTLQEKGKNNSIVNILFMNLEMFLPDDQLVSLNTSTLVGSPVISTQILSNSSRKIDQFSSPVRFRFRTREMDLPSNMTINNARCVFWNFQSGVEISETTWSMAGINTTEEKKQEGENNTLIVHCSSNHLTSFAVLMDITGVLNNITTGERLALEIVTYIGLGISIVFLLLTVIILFCLGKLVFQQLLYFIHLNLSIALLLANTTFITGLDNAVSNRYACVVVAGLLHYLYTAAFYWMLCEGLMLFFKVVITFSGVGKYLSEKWWFFFLIGWGIPVVPVTVSIGLIHKQYGNNRYCWINVSDYRVGALWAFVVPFAVVIVLNMLIFVAAIVRIFNSRKAKLEHSDSRAQRLCMMLLYNGLSLLALLGLTWVFGLFAINQATTIFLWLFTVFNSLQGAMIFFFQIARNPQIWNTLKKKRRETAKSLTQSTKISVTDGKSGKSKSAERMYQVTSPSSTMQNDSVVSSQSISFSKSTSISKFKSSGYHGNDKPSLNFTNPWAVEDDWKEDLSIELFETA